MSDEDLGCRSVRWHQLAEAGEGPTDQGLRHSEARDADAANLQYSFVVGKGIQVTVKGELQREGARVNDEMVVVEVCGATTHTGLAVAVGRHDAAHYFVGAAAFSVVPRVVAAAAMVKRRDARELREQVGLEQRRRWAAAWVRKRWQWRAGCAGSGSGVQAEAALGLTKVLAAVPHLEVERCCQPQAREVPPRPQRLHQHARLTLVTDAACGWGVARETVKR